MENCLDFENLNEFKKFYQYVRAGKSCSCFGVPNSFKQALTIPFEKKVVYLVSDENDAKIVQEKYSSLGLKTCVFPCIFDINMPKKTASAESFVTRTRTLFDVIFGNFDALVLPFPALSFPLAKVKDFKKNIIELEKEKLVQIEELERKLERAGYKKVDAIYKNGQFSKHGDVLDIFAVNSDDPYRIDFFDTEIEDIRLLDTANFKTKESLKKIKICPATDLFFENDDYENALIKLESEREKGAKFVQNEANFYSCLDEAISRVERRDNSYSSWFLSAYFYESFGNFFDYLDKNNCVFVIDECKKVFDAMSVFYKNNNASQKELAANEIILKNPPPFFDENFVLSRLKEFTAVGFLKLTNSNRFFVSDAVFSFEVSPASKYVSSKAELYRDVAEYLDSDYSVFLCAQDKQQINELESGFEAREINIKFHEKAKISDKKSSILKLGLQNGFILEKEKIYVIGTDDIFAKKARHKNLLTSDTFGFVPKVGDFVVHEIHGIGICEGVTRLSGNFGEKDYIVVRYAKGDTLYVPTTSTDLLSRFSGAEKPTKLSTLGGTEFLAVKEKVKKSVKKLAINLMKLYAEREMVKKVPLGKDTQLQRDFENSFKYTETEDQLRSVQEIKQDLMSSKVMDRLLLGDVGFGKTEVALRAAFKVITEGRQVAFLAPTTILSEQHYGTAKERMQDFGVNVQVLNRFKSKSDQTKILQDLESGKIDLICGTHRLLGDDVVFSNLGLIILDEEQKFGVEDKEKLKNKYPRVDYLTLSATPIPRTLSMSLSGIRDISTIFSPPSERLKVNTVVAEYTDALISSAIKQELSRAGQVYVLYNNVKKIYEFQEKIKKLVPEARVDVANGQMPAKVLEDAIYKFYLGETDVLVCSTIIENGVDIKNANTLIVIEADKFGLSSLYQIRGRVGRGSKLAHAYFTFEKNKVLSEDAYKRLDALLEFCDFGSGYNLSVRDLEIRGSGNIFGAEQSGHMQKVGLELYSKLLANAVKEIRGQTLVSEKDVQIKLRADAFIPETYISSAEERMTAYKRISMLSSETETQDFILELSEKFGRVPKEVKTLAQISLIRQAFKMVDALEVFEISNFVFVSFESKEKITKNEALCEAIFKFKKDVSIDTSAGVRLKFVTGADNKISILYKFSTYLLQVLHQNNSKNT